MSPRRSLPPDAPPDRRDTAPDELDFERTLARWASRPPRTPAATAARRIESRLPPRRRRRPFAGAAARGWARTADRDDRAGRGRPTPRLALAAAALAATGAIALALVLGWAVLRGGGGTLSPSEQARSAPPGAVPRAAEVVPSQGATDDVLVLDLDERTTLYLDLASEDNWSSDLGGT